MATATQTGDVPQPRRAKRPALVTVETNEGGQLLLAAVRKALAPLPVRVEPVTRTAGRNHR